MAVMAAMAFAASSASALEVAQEGGSHCPEVTYQNHGAGSGGCLVSAAGAGIELGSPLGMVVCDNSFEARVGENGEGFIYSASFTGCTVPTVPCNEAGVMDNWPAELAHGEERPAMTGPLTAEENNLENAFLRRDCRRVTVDCHLNVTGVEASTLQYEGTTGGAHRNCEVSGSVSGSWTQIIDAEHPAVEIVDWRHLGIGDENVRVPSIA